MPSAAGPSASLAIVPPAQAAHVHTQTSTLHPEHGVHDAMRHGLRSLHDETAAGASHPLQHRLESWDETQRQWKLTMQRNTFGLGMPMRTMMERKIVSHTPHMPARRVANVHLDILDGRDETLDPIDFLPSDAHGETRDIHAAMERKLGV
ncbi:unnamed protein product [Malassezia sympodialis ATCC 42132]|uniref:Similar to S.cerevisiae protein UMP1 (Chaperone required for correct maturation of the 20S proteasome) n=1 Tax=Malassezia sympodialis (strain ATCC 42132) TaxID=1230383 RepID=M5E5X2_MALS4|nr:uncharacterized protein MSY001_0211 [Malassezia sympodialis ATCC 42132]CCU97505.1 unnamed protein product [Malassezia sympodialis ATCC 42132]SHO77094.1 Similar to S.cerevisiae protein UMP1 (Chaperone required for correct maturation of the 20S proteasome) [Malassezia sympodialis ATCC 42132]|eukprot:XP_018738854.1 uncharacterized protein MSY001_0211 [Malassezia sympodialis ATCC 42132]